MIYYTNPAETNSLERKKRIAATTSSLSFREEEEHAESSQGAGAPNDGCVVWFALFVGLRAAQNYRDTCSLSLCADGDVILRPWVCVYVCGWFVFMWRIVVWKPMSGTTSIGLPRSPKQSNRRLARHVGRKVELWLYPMKMCHSECELNEVCRARCVGKCVSGDRSELIKCDVCVCDYENICRWMHVSVCVSKCGVRITWKGVVRSVDVW